MRVRLDKPTALPGATVASLSVERDLSWCSISQEKKPFGVVDVIHETRDAGIYRLNVAPGKGIPLHVHRQMDEAEMVISEGLLCQRRPVAVGAVHRWPREAAHCYDNPTSRHQTILCVDAPRFIEADEIPVSGEPWAVPAQP